MLRGPTMAVVAATMATACAPAIQRPLDAREAGRRPRVAAVVLPAGDAAARAPAERGLRQLRAAEFVVVSPPVPRTPPADAEGGAELRQARASYRDLDFDAGLSATATILAQLWREARTAEQFDRIAAALRLRAACLLALGREAEADRAFEEALALRPEADATADGFSPEVAERAEAVRRGLAASGRARDLLIESTPAGATVSVDGHAVGSAPRTVSVLPGRHRIEAAAAGYANGVWQEEVGAAAPPAVTLRLADPDRDEALRQLASGASGPAALRLARIIVPGAGGVITVRVESSAAGAVAHVERLDAGGPGVTGRTSRAIAVEAAAAITSAARQLFADAEPPAPRPSRPIWRSPWLWVGVGAVVVGAVVAVWAIRQPRLTDVGWAP